MSRVGPVTDVAAQLVGQVADNKNQSANRSMQAAMFEADRIRKQAELDAQTALAKADMENRLEVEAMQQEGFDKQRAAQAEAQAKEQEFQGRQAQEAMAFTRDRDMRLQAIEEKNRIRARADDLARMEFEGTQSDELAQQILRDREVLDKQATLSTAVKMMDTRNLSDVARTHTMLQEMATGISALRTNASEKISEAITGMRSQLIGGELAEQFRMAGALGGERGGVGREPGTRAAGERALIAKSGSTEALQREVIRSLVETGFLGEVTDDPGAAETALTQWWSDVLDPTVPEQEKNRGVEALRAAFGDNADMEVAIVLEELENGLRGLGNISARAAGRTLADDEDASFGTQAGSKRKKSDREFDKGIADVALGIAEQLGAARARLGLTKPEDNIKRVGSIIDNAVAALAELDPAAMEQSLAQLRESLPGLDPGPESESAARLITLLEGVMGRAGSVKAKQGEVDTLSRESNEFLRASQERVSGGRKRLLEQLRGG